MNKNEADVAKAEIIAKVEGYHSRMDTLAGGLRVVGYCVATYFITDMVKGIASAQPAALRELAEVVKSLQLHQWLAWSVAGLATTGYVYERLGKKRSYRKNDALRNERELSDPHRSKSGLDPNGHAPGE